MKRPKTVGIQYAALPYRFTGRRLEVMLITSRETRRWVIPKGWPVEGLRPQDAAAAEAHEEAGIAGRVEDVPLGSYDYLKRIKGRTTIPTQVIVFPLRVESQAERWKEAGQRTLRWFPCRRAAALVAEPQLKRLLRDFCRERTPRRAPARLAGWVAGFFSRAPRPARRLG